MDIEWNDSQPIYRQLRERVVGLILTGIFKEGDSLPAVRQIASDYQINHITVTKAYQELVDMELVESKRGMGMFIMQGAKEKLHQIEKEKFLRAELPAFFTRTQQLGMSLDEIYTAMKTLGEDK
jgi:GntR family transcriptional regulator